MTPDRLVARLAARQHGVFTRAQAAERGFTPARARGRLALGIWEVVHPGVYRVAGAAPSWHSEVMAACLATGGHASHRCAAALYGFGPPAPPEVVVPGGRRRAGVVCHRSETLRSADLVHWGVIPATSPVRTVADLAVVLPVEELERAADTALRLRLVTVDALRRRLATLPPRPGAAALRALLATLDPAVARAESGLEARFLRILRRAGLRHIVAQHPVVVGGRRYRVDFADPVLRVAIEVDGRHHALPHQWRRDVERQNDLVAAGFAVLRFTGEDTRGPEEVIARVQAVVRSIVAA